MKLIKRSDSVTKEQKQLGISRRVFMRNSSLAAGGAIAGASLFAPGMIRKAEAKSVDASAPIEVKRTICFSLLCRLWYLRRSAKRCLDGSRARV